MIFNIRMKISKTLLILSLVCAFLFVSCEDNSVSAPDETAVVDVINPITGRTWMDRNLGALRVATSSDDSQAYGDLYQWGRGTDGHEKRNSGTTTTLSNSDQVGHGNFILPAVGITAERPGDWRNPQNNNLWQGVNGINNPCPNGYRIPTQEEWKAEIESWSSKDAVGAFASPLKLPMAGWRHAYNGSIITSSYVGKYWSGPRPGRVTSDYLRFTDSDDHRAGLPGQARAQGKSVRCIKD